MSDNEKIGERIHSIRMSLEHDNKVSLEEFGQMINPPANKSVVRSWEKGKSIPQKGRLEQIADIGNVTTDFLLYGKKTSGYGERIRKIRIKIAGDDLEAFGRLFSPSLTAEEVEDWEQENNLPNWEQMEKLTTLSTKDHKEIIFGITPKYKEQRTINTSILFEKTEQFLKEAELTEHDYFESDLFFSMIDMLRYIQVKDNQKFTVLFQIIANLQWLSGELPRYSYSYGGFAKRIKKFDSLEEEIEFSINDIIEHLEILISDLKQKHKTN